MSTTLMFVVLACCCISKASGDAMTTDSVPVLTIMQNDAGVDFVCTKPSDDAALAPATDKVSVTKEGGTADFKLKSVAGYTVTTTNATKSVAKSAFEASDYGSYTCQLQDATTDASAPVTSTVSAAVAVPLPACSAAARLVNSMALALVCVLATVIKATY